VDREVAVDGKKPLVLRGRPRKNGRGKKTGRGEGTLRKSEGVPDWERRACAYGGLGYGIALAYIYCFAIVHLGAFCIQNAPTLVATRSCPVAIGAYSGCNLFTSGCN
jgi:hypothetical protein